MLTHPGGRTQLIVDDGVPPFCSKGYEMGRATLGQYSSDNHEVAVIRTC